jgi:LysM repeat protein
MPHQKSAAESDSKGPLEAKQGGLAMKWRGWQILAIYILLLYHVFRAMLMWPVAAPPPPAPPSPTLVPTMQLSPTATASPTVLATTPANTPLPTWTPRAPETPTVTPSMAATSTLAPSPSPSAPPTATHTSSPAPTGTPTATATAEVVKHTVESGEMLSSIARKYNVTVDAIVEANELANPDALNVGQVLIVPVQVPTLTPTPSP